MTHSTRMVIDEDWAGQSMNPMPVISCPRLGLWKRIWMRLYPSPPATHVLWIPVIITMTVTMK